MSNADFDALTRIKMEYGEMPGLKLTALQVRRLCDLPPEECERALAVLLDIAFLARSRDGAFILRA